MLGNAGLYFMCLYYIRNEWEMCENGVENRSRNALVPNAQQVVEIEQKCQKTISSWQKSFFFAALFYVVGKEIKGGEKHTMDLRFE